MMSNWALFLLITFVLGIVISNIMLLKHSAKMKLPDALVRKIAKNKKQQELKKQEKNPTDQ